MEAVIQVAEDKCPPEDMVSFSLALNVVWVSCPNFVAILVICTWNEVSSLVLIPRSITNLGSGIAIPCLAVCLVGFIFSLDAGSSGL